MRALRVGLMSTIKRDPSRLGRQAPAAHNIETGGFARDETRSGRGRSKQRPYEGEAREQTWRKKGEKKLPLGKIQHRRGFPCRGEGAVLV